MVGLLEIIMIILMINIMTGQVQNLVPHLPGLDKDKIYVISGRIIILLQNI